MQTAQHIKQNFLDDLTAEAREEIQPLHHTIIDEAIENILNGNCKIDNRPPQNRDECYISIAYSLVAGQAAPQGLFERLEKQHKKNMRLNLTFRGQKYKYTI